MILLLQHHYIQQRTVACVKVCVKFNAACYICKKQNMAEQQQPNQLNIEISEEVAEGSYANLAIITHSTAATSAITTSTRINAYSIKACPRWAGFWGDVLVIGSCTILLTPHPIKNVSC